MAGIYQYPHWGVTRPGTNHYSFGGFAYGAFRGWGQGPAPQPISAAPAVVPGEARSPEAMAYVEEMEKKAAEHSAASMSATAAGKIADAAYHARQAMLFEKEALDVRKGRKSAPAATFRARGVGVGLERLRQWWTEQTPTTKAAVAGGAGLGVAALVGLI